jgi:ribosomal protein S18 acetylase RimI-like enzyme
MLGIDIPERVVLSDKCRIWVYRDPHGELVGFGTLDVCEEYRDFIEGHPHPYIPLLAVNPTMEGRGYGKSIVRHLIGEAALLTGGSAGCHDVLFLDVYTSNDRAIGLYEKCGFAKVSDEPRPDPNEDNRPYLIMARRVSAARG